MKLLKLSLVCLALSFSSCSPQQLQEVLGTVLDSGALTDGEVSSGLKQALEIGIGKGSDQLSALDGYFKSPYKILLPPEARKITDKLSKVPGFAQVENILLEKINRGAEDAAKKAKPIFVDAIKQISFADATNILLGADDAATGYLNDKTNAQLYDAFNPVIINSLDKFNARKYWSDAVNAYNKIPFVQKADPSLDNYVTTQALNGLFSMVAKEELNIRKNVSARTSDLLKKVFAKQDDK